MLEQPFRIADVPRQTARKIVDDGPCNPGVATFLIQQANRRLNVRRLEQRKLVDLREGMSTALAELAVP
jgi:hypothetical protein